MAFEKVAKLADRGLIRNVVPIHSGKARHRFHVIQTVFHRRVAESIPLLHEMDAQHHLGRDRPAAVTRFGILSHDGIEQVLPRQPVVHPGQEKLICCMAVTSSLASYSSRAIAEGSELQDT